MSLVSELLESVLAFTQLYNLKKEFLLLSVIPKIHLSISTGCPKNMSQL